jgi:HEAT repeat protein
MASDSMAVVQDLVVPHRRKVAIRALMLAAAAATPAIRRGLHHPDPAVRSASCQVLDHYLDQAALPELLENLCRPAESESLPVAIRMRLEDPSGEVRQQAAGLVGARVHRSRDALAAIVIACRSDPHPVVRKIAGWFVPGGPRYEATKPRPVRETVTAGRTA